jgi:hypothetical protein
VPCYLATKEEFEDVSIRQDSNEEFTRRPNIYPTMIFCNPNAGYAEIFQYQSDWLEYYVKNGINVFVWNYRGYSLSEGVPSPKVKFLISYY